MRRIGAWLATNWVAGAGFMAASLILAVPAVSMPLPILLIYLCSPAYMVHQIEEHTGDRFRRMINASVFGGVEALTTSAVLWINLPGVWGVNLASLYAARGLDPGFGLAAPYLLLVNGISHIGMSVRMRLYNPGLVTGCLSFLPLGIAALWLVPATLAQHALGLVVALAIHAAIAVTIVRRAAALKRG